MVRKAIEIMTVLVLAMGMSEYSSLHCIPVCG